MKQLGKTLNSDVIFQKYLYILNFNGIYHHLCADTSGGIHWNKCTADT